MRIHGNQRAMIALSITTLLALGGCTTVPNKDSPTPDAPPRTADDPTSAKQALYTHHADWAGTPYRLGGQSRSGIDCSGFVQTTFDVVFDRSLPRTTQAQANVGDPVDRSGLNAGDLVFFHTGRKTQHVGIYVEDGQFLHASTSQGVTLSRLDSPYWASAFWKARRPWR